MLLFVCTSQGIYHTAVDLRVNQVVILSLDAISPLVRLTAVFFTELSITPLPFDIDLVPIVVSVIYPIS